jgi:hypothetical protein
LKAMIAEAAGPDVVLVDSADTVAASVERRLRDLNLMNDWDGGTVQFLATDAPDRVSPEFTSRNSEFRSNEGLMASQ